MPTDNDRVTEAQREEALRVLRRDYWQDVRGVAEDLREELKRGNVDADQESIEQWIHDTVDGHARVIYTHLAIETLLFSDNSEAYEEENGDKFGWTYELGAFYAFRQDVMEAIGDLDDLIAEINPETSEA